MKNSYMGNSYRVNPPPRPKIPPDNFTLTENSPRKISCRQVSLGIFSLFSFEKKMFYLFIIVI